LPSVLVSSEFEPDNDGCGGKARDDATRSLVGEVSRQHRERKATKSDEAEVPEYLWEGHFLSDGMTPWVVTYQTKLREAMWLLQRRMLLWWQRNMTITFLRWAHGRYPGLSHLDSKFERTVILKNNRYVWAPDSKTDRRDGYRKWWKQHFLLAGEDLHPAADVIGRAAGASWWGWDDSSRLFHWGWPRWYCRVIRDGLPVHFRGQKPTYRKPQRDANDGVTSDRMRKKLSAVKERRYIRPGFVKSLTSYFLVPKGEEDMHMVYDGTVSGLNDCIWVPCFLLPTMNTHLRGVDEETEMADVDVGECFLNFMLHSEMWELAGVDLTHYFGDGEGVVWETWERAAMGINSSPYQAVSAMAVADEVIKGDRQDE
jgi:hypothetical protein